MRTLIVNADDFGYTRDVNAGIVEAHTRGILTATTLMANGGAFEDAVRLARETPGLDVGCHLVLVGGESLVSERPFPRSVRELIQAVVLRRIDVYAELRAQIVRILSMLKPIHMDTHKHTHLFPPVLDAVARLSEEFRIPWVRRPFDFQLDGGKRLISSALSMVRPRMSRLLASHGCRSTDHFAGFGLTGRLTPAAVVELIRSLPEGVTEFMVHPGHCGEELRAMPTRLKESREQELAALEDGRVKEALAAEGVRLSGYRGLA